MSNKPIHRFFSCIFVSLLFSVPALAETSRFSPLDNQSTAFADIKHLSHVVPDAPKGGRINLGSVTNFDSMNFMRTPGRPPAALAHTFDTLLVSANTPATYYGLLASEIDIASDFSTARFVIDQGARWHDGTPVTSHDAAFTFEMLGAHGLPFYRFIVSSLQIVTPDDRTIILRNSKRGDWQWIDQLGRFPIQSKSWWQGREPGEITLDIPLGSGPYQVQNVEFNRVFTLERAPDYWAADHPLNVGRWNFDVVNVDYYFDRTVMVEALKRGDIDVLREFDAIAWRSRYDGPALDEGRIVQTKFRRQDAGALSYIVMNLRRKPLDDIRVREALSLAFDPRYYHELWGQVYDLPGSFYGQTRFAAEGRPGPAEMELLSGFTDALPEGVLDPIETPEFNMRSRARRANALLDAPGFIVKDGRRIDQVSQRPFTLELVSASPASVSQLEPYRVMLEKLGIALEITSGDYVSARRRILEHKFDLTQVSWRPGDPPGASERLSWHSSQKAPGSYGLAGLESDLADHLIDIMRTATDPLKREAAARAFDRFLQAGHFTIPLWHDMEQRFAHNPKLGFPENGYVPVFVQERWFWREPPVE